MRNVIMVLVLGAVCAGCGLSPKQAASLDRYEAAMAAASERLQGYEVEVAQIREMIAAGKVAPADALAMLAKVAANKDADLATIREATAAVKELRTGEVPWWYYIGPALAAVLGIAGGYIPGARKAAAVVQQLDQAGRIIGSMVHGVEVGGDKGTKAAIAAEATRNGVAGPLHAAVRDGT